MKKIFLGLLCSVLLFCAVSAHAFTITLGWDPNSEPDIASYRVYVGTESRQYAQYFEALPGEENGFVLPADFPNGVTHYFAITALNWGGLESTYSNEVRSDGVTNPGNNPPAAPGGCFIISVAP